MYTCIICVKYIRYEIRCICVIHLQHHMYIIYIGHAIHMWHIWQCRAFHSQGHLPYVLDMHDYDGRSSHKQCIAWYLTPRHVSRQWICCICMIMMGETYTNSVFNSQRCTLGDATCIEHMHEYDMISESYSRAFHSYGDVTRVVDANKCATSCLCNYSISINIHHSISNLNQLLYSSYNHQNHISTKLMNY